MEIRPTFGDSSWFVHDRFGLFIHWGLYSLSARRGWLRMEEKIPTDVYIQRYFKHFDPDLYDPNLWADAAAQAGMKYFVMTTKHHEGFCLWDTRYTDFKAPNTPARRDLIRPAVEAFRARGFRTGFYYSLIDWDHPHYRYDAYYGPWHDPADRERLNATRDQSKYAQYIRDQVTELLTRYGKIDMMWFDFAYPYPDGKNRDDFQSQQLWDLVRKLQPHMLIDDRLDLPDNWDFKTPEKTRPREWVTHQGQRVVWEACHPFSDGWGYQRDEGGYKSVEQLVTILIDSVSKGGNFLLNVGPTARGKFDERALERLRGIGRWMHHHGRSIYGCTQAPAEYPQPEDCRLTWNPATRRLYVHVLAWPFKDLYLDGLAGKVEYAQLLNDASELKMSEPADDYNKQRKTLTLHLPTIKPNVTVPVVELFMK